MHTVVKALAHKILPNYEVDVVSCGLSDECELRAAPIPIRGEPIERFRARWRMVRASINGEELRSVQAIESKLRYLSAQLDETRPAFRIGKRPRRSHDSQRR
jgi:hypothetical protein